jgi:gamma-glutamylcyclotransferase (GGCT)/AIG2-like uncharacterized protein YtfP
MREAEFVGEAATEPRYLLVNCGSYPGLVKAANDKAGMAVRGELYRVDDELLAALDSFEDVPQEYVREAIQLADGSEAQTYLYLLGTAGLSVCGADWVE